MSKGMVYLVGAGPGDKNLLTLEADRLIAQADVVVYDRLVSQDIMELVPRETELINVGKNVGNHQVTQEEINRILLAQAKLGKQVVRLKGGDPFLFGRGGEELELLIEEGIPFKVVPGITSAVAAPSYAGIPVTHRDFCASVHIISGHSAKWEELPIDYEALVRLNGTLVFLMSVASMPVIAKGLMAAGMEEDTEVAFVENATRFNQRKILTTLKNCEEDIKKHKVQSPATIVVGRVCNVSHRYDWFSKQSLKGCRILVTRPDKTAGALWERLSNLGAFAQRLPLIETRELDFQLNLEDKDILVFTSAIGVEAFFNKLKSEGLDSRSLYGKKLAVVGKQTAKALEQYGLVADLVPKTYSGEALGRALLSQKLVGDKSKLGIYRAKEGSQGLIEVLTEEGIAYEDVATYETITLTANIDPRDYDYVTFTSESTVKSFVASLGQDFDYSKVKGVCIGEQTAKVASENNMKVFVSKEATIDSIIERINELWILDQED